MNRCTRALAALATTAVVATATAAPASAARWTHQDAVGDVQTQTIDFTEEIPEEPEYVLAPDNVDTDVTSVTVRHRPAFVQVDTTLRDIRRSSGDLYLVVRAAGREYFALARLGGRTAFGGPQFMFARDDLRGGRCERAGATVDRAADTATIFIPRACLDRPGAVRVGVGVAKLDQPTRDSLAVHVDDALLDGEVRDVIKMSPRIAVG